MAELTIEERLQLAELQIKAMIDMIGRLTDAQMNVALVVQGLIGPTREKSESVN